MRWPRTGLGKSDRPGSSGGSGKHSYGRTRHPLHNRKSGNGNSLPKVLVRSVSIPLTVHPANPKTVKTVRISKGDLDHPVETR
jgi:hypothetical protein